MDNSQIIKNRQHARLAGITPGSFEMQGGFWGKRRQALRQTIIPTQYQKMIDTGRIENFLRASGKSQAPYKGFYFNDSDLYKWLEAACWMTEFDPDPAISKMIDESILVIEGAQEENGYLDTYFMFERETERWTNLRDLHELYCAGHLFEAAVAHAQVAKSNRLLNVAINLADHIAEIFNPQSRKGTPGHPEIELALIKLAEKTGNQKYLELSQFFIDQRGYGIIGGGAYHQDHVPFRELNRLPGHAVRAMYLCCGATDLYQYTGDPAIKAALERCWEHLNQYQLYISGGIGSRYQGEAFGDNYELPNATAYAETCAAIGSVMWNHRMLQTEADARYADLMEWTLYNAVLPGISLDHTAYFYVNPLANDGSHRRQPWFDCACCPPNVARLLASLPRYFFSTNLSNFSTHVTQPEIWIHTYAKGILTVPIPDNRGMTLAISTEYPWNGNIEIEILNIPEGIMPVINLRIPGWCSSAEASLNGQPIKNVENAPAYLKITDNLKKGDVLQLKLDLQVKLLESHPKILENTRHLSLIRGPILYCLEQEDNPGIDLARIKIDPNQPFKLNTNPNLMEGLVTLESDAWLEAFPSDWEGKLYRPYQKTTIINKPVRIKAIPYFAWANRSSGPMQVWINSTTK